MSAYPSCSPETSDPFDIVKGLAVGDDKARAVPDFEVQLTLPHSPDNGVIEYVAAAPPDYRSSYAGSALPFASPRQAFELSPNCGTVQVQGNQAYLRIQFPNSYYTGLGTIVVPPTVYIRYMHGGRQQRTTVKLSQGVPYRALAPPPLRTGAEFYDNIWDLPVRSQEHILLDSAYPRTNTEAPDFWGLKPAV